MLSVLYPRRRLEEAPGSLPQTGPIPAFTAGAGVPGQTEDICLFFSLPYGNSAFNIIKQMNLFRLSSIFLFSHPWLLSACISGAYLCSDPPN